MRPGLLLGALLLTGGAAAHSPLVLLTDFGLADGAVSEMKGVAYTLAPDLVISDLSHENGSIFEGAYRLYQAESFWPTGSVFVCVVDPGVGTARLSLVVKTRTGHYFVGPDNGLMSLAAERDGIDAVRQIDEKVNRRPGSDDSHTFHGRDVFVYTGARLAAGLISFDQVGPVVPTERFITLKYAKPQRQGETLTGIVPVLDVQYGNVWTNIPKPLFDELKLPLGGLVHVRILHQGKLVDEARVPYQRTFGEVPVGKPLLYINSLLNVAVALNQGSYAAAHQIESGPDWSVEVSRN